MNLARVVYTCLLISIYGFNLVFSQTAFIINDSQKVQLEVSQFQQSIQRSRPGEMGLEIDSIMINVDGEALIWEGFRQRIGNLITVMPSRSIVVTNPLPNKLGTLWDFQIMDYELGFTSARCTVTCRYELIASGIRTGAGTIEFEKVGRGWRFSEINGFLPLLNEELASLRAKRQGAKSAGDRDK